LALRDKNALDNRQEIVLPAAKAGLVLRTETAEGGGGLFKVSPPFERVAAPQNERHVELRFQIYGSALFQFEVAIPGGAIEPPVIEGMRVVQEARAGWLLLRGKSAARNVPPFEAKHLQSCPAEVGLQNQTVMSRTEYDAVIGHQIEEGRVPCLTSFPDW